MSIATDSTEQRNDRRYAQLQTAKHAHRFEQRWTTADDVELMTGSGTIAARAKRLGRTYYAACYRLQLLRKQAAQRRAELAA